MPKLLLLLRMDTNDAFFFLDDGKFPWGPLEGICSGRRDPTDKTRRREAVVVFCLLGVDDTMGGRERIRGGWKLSYGSSGPGRKSDSSLGGERFAGIDGVRLVAILVSPFLLFWPNAGVCAQIPFDEIPVGSRAIIRRSRRERKCSPLLRHVRGMMRQSSAAAAGVLEPSPPSCPCSP